MTKDPIERRTLAVERELRHPPGARTVVTWSLTPTKDGVVLRMEQSGFREDQEANDRGAKYGWNKMLVALEGALGPPARTSLRPSSRAQRKE